MLVQPRLEVRVPQEGFLGSDAAHDSPKVGVVCRHAQVLVLLVVRLQLRPHVLLQVRDAFVVDEAVLVQPRLEVRVPKEGLFAPDSVHDAPKVGVAVGHAQVLVLLVVRLQLRPHVLLQVRGAFVVDEAVLVQPRLEVRVPKEGLLGSDAAHDIPKVGVALRHAQVLVLLVVRLQLRPHVLLQVRDAFVVDEAVLVQPRLEVRVPQEGFLGSDAAHDSPKVGVVCRHAQVLVLLVVRLQLRPHVLLQVRDAFVVDEAVLVQPRLEVRVPQEGFLGSDAAHDSPKVGVVCRHAQVLVLLVVRLQLRPHVLLQVRDAFVVDEAVLVQPRLEVRVPQEAVLGPDMVHDISKVGVI